MVWKEMWQQNQPGAQFITHCKYREKRQPRFLQLHMKPQTNLIMIITTFINSLSQRWDFHTLPFISEADFSPQSAVSPPLCLTVPPPPVSLSFHKKRGNENITTNSKATNCRQVFLETIMGTVLSGDP